MKRTEPNVMVGEPVSASLALIAVMLGAYFGAVGILRWLMCGPGQSKSSAVCRVGRPLQ